MDDSVKNIYRLMFKKSARVLHCIKRKYGYDVHLEWDYPNIYDLSWGKNYIERKLVVLAWRQL